jgi:hypothetical protein
VPEPSPAVKNLWLFAGVAAIVLLAATSLFIAGLVP